MNKNAKTNSFSTACANCAKKIVEQIGAVKQSLLREFGETVAAHKQLVALALNEAEALAAETPYPHLFFPALAEEKVRAVNHWSRHQQAVRRTDVSRRLRA